MLFGSYSDIIKSMNQLKDLGKKTVFTTSLESIIGRTVTGILASGLGSSEVAHGLATASFLSNDLSNEKEIIERVRP